MPFNIITFYPDLKLKRLRGRKYIGIDCEFPSRPTDALLNHAMKNSYYLVSRQGFFSFHYNSKNQDPSDKLL